MRKIKPTIRLFIFLRLASLVAGYDLILSESAAMIPAHAAAAENAEILRTVHSRDLVLYGEEYKKPSEHVFDTGPAKSFFRKPVKKFWQIIYEKNKKPGHTIFDIGRVFYKYRRG